MADLRLGELVDPATHERTGTPALVTTGELTTHGVIVGMTGSGKTGLGLVLIEEALSAGVPCLLIDPKGDLTNLCLTFPNLAPADFRPWINEGDAQTAGVTPEAFAEQQATAWRDGLAGWGITTERIQSLRAGTDLTIYTPGSTAGVPLNVVGSLDAPADATDVEVMRDEIEGYVSGLLGMVGIDADPLSSREHILLSNLIEASWAQGRSLDLGTLVGQVQRPPLRKLGVFELDQFFPPADRGALAIRLNGLLASPSFAAWSEGPPLDIARLLRTSEGKPAAAIVTVAHLSDEERQFVVALVLAKLVTWMRKQSGTTDLRTLVYMDEVMGYVPPTAAPPTKKPIMTLMKQARAFGVGVVLATQNPVDIDYKAISNAGTWMVGRLQTERDKDRLLDGMSAAAGGVDLAAVGDTISGLAKREFVLRRAGKDAPVVLTTRWAMSYLRGPLTRDQIATLMAAKRVPAADGGVPADAARPEVVAPEDDAVPTMPEVAEGVGVCWVDPAAPWLGAVVGAAGGPAGRGRHSAAAVARVRLRYDEEKADLVVDEEYEVVLHPLTAVVDAAAVVPVDYDERDLLPAGPEAVSYVLPEASIRSKTFWSTLEKELVAHLARSRTMEIFANRQLRLYSRAGETKEDFAARCREVGAAKADEEAAKLRDRYETKVRGLQEKLHAAQDRADVLAAEASGREQEELLSAAGSILGGFLGGRRSSSSIARDLRSAAGRRTRARAASERLDAAQGKVSTIAVQLDELEDELSEDILRITGAWEEKATAIDSVPVSLERTDIEVTHLALAWVPVA